MNKKINRTTYFSLNSFISAMSELMNNFVEAFPLWIVSFPSKTNEHKNGCLQHILPKIHN